MVQIYVFQIIYMVMIIWGLYMSKQCAQNSHYMKNRVLVVFIASNAASFSYFCSMLSQQLFLYDLFSSFLYVSMDITVMALLYYLVDFTTLGLNYKYSSISKVIFLVILSADIILNLTNPITHWEIEYIPHEYMRRHIIFEPQRKMLFNLHLSICYIIVALCIFILYRKCIKTPKAYRKRYSNILIMVLIIVFLNFIFLFTTDYFIFDPSYPLYSICAYSVYKNTFYFSNSQSMNNSKRLILEYLNSPVALFDYENKLNDCNQIFLDVFPEAANYRDIPISLSHFEELTGLSVSKADGNTIIQKEYEKEETLLKYHCHINEFHDEAGKFLGHILILNDVTKELNALDAAESAGRAKSSFLSSMSHEIRTPINAVLGMDEMILRESNDPQILEYANNINNAGKLLLSIINDILDISKMESGSMNIVATDYQTSNLIRSLHAIIDLRAKNKGLDMIFDIDPKLPSVLNGDEMRIQQCITNLLTNAVKYTPSGSVTLSISAKPNSSNEIYLAVSVSDTGIGIKNEDMKKLFKTFQRLDESRNRNIEGTGLGLHLTDNLIHLMGGSIRVESRYGEGSTFSFEIPQHVIDATPNVPDDVKSQKQQSKYQVSFIAPDAHILVVDDNKVNLAVFKGLLKNTRINIDTALSAFQAIEKVKENPYDIIFLDHMMPEMDGIECLEEMMKMSDNLCSNAPVIALTANVYSGANLFYKEKGFSDYLSKPVDTKLVEEALIKYLPAKLVELKSN